MIRPDSLNDLVWQLREEITRGVAQAKSREGRGHYDDGYERGYLNALRGVVAEITGQYEETPPPWP